MAALVQPADNRPRFSFTILEKWRLYPTDPQKVTFVPLSLGQETDGYRAAEATKSGAMTEFLRRSVILVDGKAPDEMWLDNASPKVRANLAKAYRQLFDIDEDEFADFFKSKEVEIR